MTNPARAMRHAAIAGVTMLRMAAALGSAAAIALMPVASRADPQSLSGDFPVRIKDAFTTDAGNVTLQWAPRVTEGRDDLWSVRGGPGLKIGLLPGTEFSIQPARQAGSSDSVHGQFAGFELEQEFTRQSRFRPALLVALIRDQPYGGGHDGPRTEVQGIATKFLGPDKASPRLTVEVAWLHLATPRFDERSHRFRAGIAWSHLVDRHSALVLDATFEQRDRPAADAEFIDLGVTHEIGQDVRLGLGVGPGLSAASPAARLFIGAAWTVHAF